MIQQTHQPKSASKIAPRIALVEVDSAAVDLIKKAFEPLGIQLAAFTADDFAKRLSTEKFEGCIVILNDAALPILEAARSSPRNRRMILYGILHAGVDVRRFSRYGINAVLDMPLERSELFNIARSTCVLLFNELRRYVRIPLVIAVAAADERQQLSGSSREVSGGGMSVKLDRGLNVGGKLHLTFSLPGKPTIRIAANIAWQQQNLVGFQFCDADPSRQVVKDWINSFLGLN